MPRTRESATWLRAPALAIALAAHVAPAAGWTPQQPVEFVSPNGPGSSVDNNVRLIHKLWGDLKDKSVTGTVVTRAGGEHLLAYTYVRQRTGNPHLLGLATSVLLTSHISGRSAITYRIAAATPMRMENVKTTATSRTGMPPKPRASWKPSTTR